MIHRQPGLSLLACMIAITFPLISQNSAEYADNVVFTATLDKPEHRTGEPATIRLMLLNHGSSTIYVSHRGLATCGIWTGYTQVQIFSDSIAVPPRGGCHAFAMRIRDEDLKQVLTNSNSWVALLPGEIYGQEQLLDLPLKPGNYQIHAELQPPGFSEDQLRTLDSENLRVLRQPHAATTISVRVR